MVLAESMGDDHLMLGSQQVAVDEEAWDLLGVAQFAPDGALHVLQCRIDRSGSVESHALPCFFPGQRFRGDASSGEILAI